MADYTGMTVQVTLKQPQSLQLFGVVQEVIAGQTLTLQNVFFPSTGRRWETFTVPGTAIADLQVVQEMPLAPQTPLPASNVQTPSAFAPPHVFSICPPREPILRPSPIPTPQAYPQVPQQTQQLAPQTAAANDFIDPAILSYGKSPTPAEPFQQPSEAPSTPVKSMLAKAAASLPTNSSPFIGDAGKIPMISKIAPSPQKPRRVLKVQTQVQQPTQLGGEELNDQVQDDANGKKKTRRGQKKKAQNSASGSADPPPVMNVEVSRNGNDMDGAVKRGKGWRQGPFLQPSPQTASPVGGATSSKQQSRRQRGQKDEMQNNGWATEDATDIQGLDDFDFEANHKLFDKKQVFDELRQGDTTADEDRLVSHNRLARPGTYGGKNLHPTENVLSPKIGPKPMNSDKGSTSDADTELNFAVNGRSSSRHSVSRSSVAAKKQPSRQNSGLLESRTVSSATSRPTAASLPPRDKSLASVTAASERIHSPHSGSASFRTPASSASYEPRLVMDRSRTKCPVLHPAALETLENETISRFGLTQEAITESGARSIAEVAFLMFESDHNSRRGSRTNTVRGSVTSSMHIDRNAEPVVVILAGNHNLGARAVAAARHLVGRKTTIIIAEAVPSDQQEAQVRSQITVVKRMIRAGASIRRGVWRKSSQYIKNLTGPPALIIDALLTGSTYDSFLQAHAVEGNASPNEVREMIDWANRSRAPVLSIGCPSGVNGIDGSSTLVEGEPLAVRPEKVLCLGGPMQGLLEAMKNGERWEVSVADTGINITLRSEEAISFGPRWIADLRYLEEDGEVTQ